MPRSQGYIWPGFRGFPTFVVHNFSPHPFAITRNQRFCHLVVHELDQDVGNPYQGGLQDTKGGIIKAAVQSAFGMINQSSAVALNSFAQAFGKNIAGMF